MLMTPAGRMDVFPHQSWRRTRRLLLDAHHSLTGEPLVVLLGPHGSGKTLMLTHLARTLVACGEDVKLVDGRAGVAAAQPGTVLLIDNADALDDATLAARLRQPGRFSVLAGPDTFADRLATLAVTPRTARLDPLTPEDVREFVERRLAQAGYRETTLAPDMVAGLGKRSGGLVGPLARLIHEAILLERAAKDVAEPMLAAATTPAPIGIPDAPQAAAPRVSPGRSAVIGTAERPWRLAQVAEGARAVVTRQPSRAIAGAVGCFVMLGLVVTAIMLPRRPHPEPHNAAASVAEAALAPAVTVAAQSAPPPVSVAPPAIQSSAPAAASAEPAPAPPAPPVGSADKATAATPHEASNTVLPEVTVLGDARLPAAAPPHVVVLFERGSVDAEQRAVAIARSLPARMPGLTADVAAAADQSRPEVRYFFAEDRDNAEAVQDDLGNQLGTSRLELSAQHAQPERPGTIEVMVGLPAVAERSTMQP